MVKAGGLQTLLIPPMGETCRSLISSLGAFGGHPSGQIAAERGPG